MIGIIGCGWLGLPLAKVFIEKRFTVKGTTTSEDKLQILRQEKIHPYYVLLSETAIQGPIDAFLKDVTTLIINVPPKLRGTNTENYVAKMQLLHHEIKNTSVKNIVFVSSTSVYGDFDGIVTEKTTPTPNTESGHQLLLAEQVFKEDTNLKITIIRFGGLISEDRHPVTMLSKKTNLKNGHHPVNLIHRNDCIRIILAVVENDWWNEIINGVYPEHPTKKEYYTAEAIERGLKKPEYDADNSEKGKIITSSWLLNVKKFEFLTPIKK